MAYALLIQILKYASDWAAVILGNCSVRSLYFIRIVRSKAHRDYIKLQSF